MKIETVYNERKTREVEVTFPLFMSYEYHPDGGGGSVYLWMRIDAEDKLSTSGTIDGTMHSIEYRSDWRKGEGEWIYGFKQINVAQSLGPMFGEDAYDFKKITAEEFYKRVEDMQLKLSVIPGGK